MTTTTAYPPISLISSDPPVSGFIEPGFERVKDQFIAHFKTGKGTGLEELGSSFAAFYKGRCVVCLFGGYADQSRTKLFDKVRELHSNSMDNIQALIPVFIFVRTRCRSSFRAERA
jgi:hypothetical protein